MKLLELNLKKLSKIADESISLRDYSPLDGGAYQARIKGIINETRAMKYTYADPKIREAQFQIQPNDVTKLYNSIE